MKRWVIAAGLCAMLSGLVLQGSFGHYLLVLCAGLYIGVPLALFMALWFLIGVKRTGAIPSGLSTIFQISILIGGSLLLSLATGAAIHQWQIHQVRAYVATVVSMLDAYKKQHGEYPHAFSEFAAPPPPELLSVSVDSNGYRFKYWDPSGMMDGYAFDSSKREWIRFD